MSGRGLRIASGASDGRSELMMIPKPLRIALACVGLGILIGPALSADTHAPVWRHNVIVPMPKVDGEGYLPNATKRFFISGPQAVPDSTFRVMDLTGHVVYSGKLGDAAIDDMAASGEMVVAGDFSHIKKPGVYRIEVGNEVSAP